jgi:hypothetical protein
MILIRLPAPQRTALPDNVPLYTRNAEDFKGLDDLVEVIEV